MTDALQNLLKQLRLSGLLSTLEVRLHEAAANRLDHREFLELILHDELAVRSRSPVATARQGRPVPRGQGARSVRLGLQSQHPQKADLRAGDVQLRAPPSRRVAPGSARRRQKFFGAALGYHAIKAGFLVLYRSVFDLVRDFLHDELLGDGDKMLAKYLKPDLLIID